MRAKNWFSVLCPLFFAFYITGCADRKGPPAPVSVNSTSMQTANLPSIIVRRGDTVGNVAKRYRITPGEIITLNRLKPPHHLQIGQKLFLPHRVMGGGSISPVPARGSSVPAFSSEPPKPGQVTVVPLNDPAPAVVNSTVQPENSSALDQPIPLVKSKPEVNKEIAEKGPMVVEKPEPLTAPQAEVKQQARQTETTAQIEQKKSSDADKIQPAIVQLEEAIAEGKKDKGSGQFAWPVKGKILKGFGKAESGFQNDGINIQAGEGDPIQCADDGVVAYVGNELQGFGNLVMVKHRNGWMSAYAHCSETLVKRGDKVKRGKIIAKVGHTGSVRSPQLHFELRKKTKAVDPMSYLE